MDILPILVTWDFTDVSAYALEHAVRMSSMSGKNIVLLHILKNDSEEETVVSQLKQFQKSVKENMV